MLDIRSRSGQGEAAQLGRYQPSLDEVRRLAQHGNLVPIYREILADLETPVSAYLKLRDGQSGFLLESADMTSATGRYSFLGVNPLRMFVARGKEITITSTVMPSTTYGVTAW